ncbi:Yqey-like domain containing protein [Naviculisporaceae sp. PSN 640]
MALRFSNPAALQRILLRPSSTTTTTTTTSRITFLQRTRTATARFYSDEPAPPPLLSKMKGDLKTAMRAKDTTRLSVLRSILAATLNASKTASPIRTDAQLVALLRKTAQTSQDAIEGFKSAGREDLVEKEAAQVKILLEYAAESGVEALDEAQLGEFAEQAKALVAQAGDAPSMSNIMKKLVAPGGLLEGKDYDKAVLAKISQRIAAAK